MNMQLTGLAHPQQMCFILLPDSTFSGQPDGEEDNSENENEGTCVQV